MSYFEKREIKEISSILANPLKEKTMDDCKSIMNFDTKKVSKWNTHFNTITFDTIYNECSLKYDLKNVELNLENCISIIKETNSYFKNNYVFYDSLDSKREECSKKYLNPTFSIWTFFNINNDFKTSVVIDFALDFFTDIWEENSVEYLKNREEAKIRLIKLLEINPKVEIALEDVYLYTNKAIINLNLEPLKEYKIKLSSFDTSIWEKTSKSEFVFTTPENKYFWMKVVEPLSIYTKDNLPKLQILDYNTPKTSTKVKLCRIPEETYAKVEVLSSSDNKEVSNKFFKDEIETLKTYECIEKNIIFKDEKDINQNKIIKKDFNFSDFINEKDPRWLYFVYFSNKDDVEFNSRVNTPIFFWVVNSHVMMKTSKWWQWFFFVNDFAWNPLPNQKIEVYLNNFDEVEKTYNMDSNDYKIKYNSVIDRDVYGEKIELWVTDGSWILIVDLKSKVDDYFNRTFEDVWEYDWNKMYRSFLVKSYSEDNMSYLVSTWNSWIAPWNFWYTTDYTYDENQISLQRWWDTQKYYSHIYTDRKLYLPGEQVNIKLVLRNANDLSIPKSDETFKLKISNPKWEDIFDKEIKLNEFWSYSDSLSLRADFTLWTYNIYLFKDEQAIYYSNFSVEVFKNPKFKNEVMLKTTWLNNEFVDIKDTVIEKWYYYENEVHTWKFTINADVISSYFSGPRVKNAQFTYKVYKQDYYSDNYWDDCYYWCFWEPYKEFYTEWTWTLDASWIWKINIDVDFRSSYSDYKYIVEVTVTDETGDTITWSNSVIAKLPEEFKKYNNQLSLKFNSSEKFVKTWNKVDIKWKLSLWKWTDFYNDKYIFIVKRKEYLNKKVKDVNGYDRNVQSVNEIVEKVMYVNDKNFDVSLNWELSLSYKLDKNSEYIFEYGLAKNYSIWEFLWLREDEKIEKKYIDEIVEKFNKEKTLYVENYLEDTQTVCDDKENCEPWIITKRLYLRDLIDSTSYIPVITYSNSTASNPIENDNKLRVISEKVSYKLWETAKILVRLPVSNSKILWTVEKNGVITHEYIDVVWNVFFKEVKIDDSFIPNAYIWVMMVDTTKNVIWEYKVWYTEIVVDKTDKKAFIEIDSDKKTYKPRDQVNLNLKVKNWAWDPVQSELTVMVVDDSLISLMWNVDLNTLEKIFVKMPFSVQTSITNIAMLRNYYFSRLWIVGWSWYGDFKWWDSAVSTRNIFKNTAYFNPSVITDEDWKAKVNFTLPDNLTNFRVMVISNSKSNFFWYEEEFIEVRKNVILEDKTPFILRDWDVSIISANLFNNSKDEIKFKVILTTKWIEVTKPEKLITLKSWENKNISWQIQANDSVDEVFYTISALWDSSENSDKIENKIKIKESPVLIKQTLKSWILESYWSLNLQSVIDKNTSLDKSKVELIFSNSRLSWIEKIVSSLAIYPYGCIEQTTSSTIPNVIIKQFDNLFKDMFDLEKVDTNIKSWVERIISMQTSDWWFAYWQGNSNADLHITPYVLRSLIYMKKSWVKIDDVVINKAIDYLEKNYENSVDLTEKTEIFWALKYAWKNPWIDVSVNSLDRHSLLAYTYWLVYSWKKDIEKVKSNIEILKKKITAPDSNWYRDTTSDKAIFLSLLLDLNDSSYNPLIEELVWDLYNYDWDSYYYSTQSKNNAFIAFYKYLEKNKANNKASFSFKLWNFSDNKKYNLWGDNLNFIKLEYDLKNVAMMWESLNLSIWNNGENKVYVDYIIKEYPLDKEKVESYSNWVQVKREIYEVKNESLLNKCSNEYYYYEENKVNCDDVFTKVTEPLYIKWKLYKTKITVTFPDERVRRNVTVEDYLPWSFRVINSKFRTESSSITWASNNWNWDYKEFNSDVIMWHASYFWWREAIFEYYFKPEFAGTYTHPPVTTYMMYDPLIRANGKFSTIQVR